MKSAYLNVGIAPMRAEPTDRSEMVSQALLWMPLNVLVQHEKWSRCQTPDNYEGWIENRALAFIPAGPQRDPIESTVMAWPLWTFVRATPDHHAPALVEVVRGVCFPDVRPTTESWRQALLPDGKIGYIPASDVRESISSKAAGTDLLAAAADCLGISYLWGGISPKGFDCSGFTQAVFGWFGIRLPRDSQQQAQVGEPLTPQPDFLNVLPGDLLFFANDAGAINHVAISARGSRFIHAGRLVEYADLRSSPLGQKLQCVRRILSLQ